MQLLNIEWGESWSGDDGPEEWAIHQKSSDLAEMDHSREIWLNKPQRTRKDGARIVSHLGLDGWVEFCEWVGGLLGEDVIGVAAKLTFENAVEFPSHDIVDDEWGSYSCWLDVISTGWSHGSGDQHIQEQLGTSQEKVAWFRPNCHGTSEDLHAMPKILHLFDWEAVNGERRFAGERCHQVKMKFVGKMSYRKLLVKFTPPIRRLAFLMRSQVEPLWLMTALEKDVHLINLTFHRFLCSIISMGKTSWGKAMNKGMEWQAKVK
jgi:hypothetical protein